ncbi:hypothetical protein [Embleya sp. AB8]|uniref:hypothetical protein n=1 Tax=Embleya sp. AB8 TaxID=3156304 RepID=UPI003C7898DD
MRPILRRHTGPGTALLGIAALTLLELVAIGTTPAAARPAVGAILFGLGAAALLTAGLFRYHLRRTPRQRPTYTPRIRSGRAQTANRLPVEPIRTHTNRGNSPDRCSWPRQPTCGAPPSATCRLLGPKERGSR